MSRETIGLILLCLPFLIMGVLVLAALVVAISKTDGGFLVLAFLGGSLVSMGVGAYLMSGD